MDEMNEQGHLSSHPESSDDRGTNIFEPNMSRGIVRGVSTDSHYFLLAYFDNGMTQHHAVQDQTNLDIGVHSNFHPPRGNMHNLPPPTFLQDDEIVQEIPLFLDHHSDMRLDIDHMSYEELLVLGEGIGNVGKGLLEEVIVRQMQTKTYLLPNNLEEQEIDLCIICQDEYKNKENIGILQCGHEYHANCIRRWLRQKNVCPMCKSTALAIG